MARFEKEISSLSKGRTAMHTTLPAANSKITSDISPVFILGLLVLSGLVVGSYANFLLFHTLVEIFSIVIAISIFIVAWNTREISDNSYLLFLGIVYLFVGSIDLMHTLSYKGMNIFVGYGPNLPTQLWIGARLLESISLVIAPIFFSKRLDIYLTLSVYSVVCMLFLSSLFIWPIFPDCFVEGSGLTLFKKNCEYFISFVLCLAVYILCRNRQCLDNPIFNLVVASLFLTIISEIAFTFYVSVYGLSNLIGHIFKVVSFYLVYQAVVVATLARPYRNLFGKISESEAAKEKVILELQEAAKEVRLLQGFLPICASCKQIRDDKGYWSQIEEYISEHSEVQFSHSICPGCTKTLYPDFYEEIKENM